MKNKSLVALFLGSIAFVSSGTAFAVVKVCSAVSPGNWRDTMTVPSTITLASCRDFAIQTAATHYQLACMENSGQIHWGPGKRTSDFVQIQNVRPQGIICGWTQ